MSVEIYRCDALQSDERIAVINIQFFQATAIVIPTLLIAVVFTGKLMDNWKLELDEKKVAPNGKGGLQNI
jgi:hypothetical protein